MDVDEVTRWVRQFGDEILREADLGRRLDLLVTWRDAFESVYPQVRGVTLYRARLDGWTTEALADLLGVDRHTVARHAEEYAASQGLPSMSRPGVPSIGSVRTLGGPGTPRR